MGKFLQDSAYVLLRYVHRLGNFSLSESHAVKGQDRRVAGVVVVVRVVVPLLARPAPLPLRDLLLGEVPEGVARTRLGYRPAFNVCELVRMP